MDIVKQLGQEFGMTPEHSRNIIILLNEGNTVPFIARYRKEMTGSVNDQVLRAFVDRYDCLMRTEKRREEVGEAISARNAMTPEIRHALDACATMTEIEDVYRPFRQKKKTRASEAEEKGLRPLAEFILAGRGDPYAEAAKYVSVSKNVQTRSDALAGAKDIMAETISDDAGVRKKVRSLFELHGVASAKLVKDNGKGTYAVYDGFSCPVQKLKSHQILALNRGEKEMCLKVKLMADADVAKRACTAGYAAGKDSRCARLITEAAEDAYDRLIEPSVERETRNSLTERASEQAIKTYEENLRPLLLQPPLKGKTVLGMDPGYRTGCKVAVVDETGAVLDTAVIYPVPPKNLVSESKAVMKRLIFSHRVDVIAIGNGTAGKETEIFVADLLKEVGGVTYAVVNEAGASVYSAGPLAAEEFPDYDLTLRSAISIARRLQDPLSELIKTEPEAIGVGQYQHDMDRKRLSGALGGVCEDCVNSVGVDLNTASESLLRYVAGLNRSVAKSIVEYRKYIGKFSVRGQLLKVPHLGPKAFEQCAGFLRIPGGDNIFDNTAVHPESYGSALKLLNLFGYTERDVEAGRIGDLPKKADAYGRDRCAAVCGLDRATLDDIISELVKPGRDIRDTLPAPKLRRDLMSPEDLAPGMTVDGVVRNVVDFGAFVDIGVHRDALVHISEITDRYIKHPSEVLRVGQNVTGTILSVDEKGGRISMTLKHTGWS